MIRGGFYLIPGAGDQNSLNLRSTQSCWNRFGAHPELWRPSPGRAWGPPAWAKFLSSPPSAHRCSPLLLPAVLVLRGDFCARTARSLPHPRGPGDGEAASASGCDVGALAGCGRKKCLRDPALKPQASREPLGTTRLQSAYGCRTLVQILCGNLWHGGRVPQRPRVPVAGWLPLLGGRGAHQQRLRGADPGHPECPESRGGAVRGYVQPRSDTNRLRARQLGQTQTRQKPLCLRAALRRAPGWPALQPGASAFFVYI